MCEGFLKNHTYINLPKMVIYYNFIRVKNHKNVETVTFDLFEISCSFFSFYLSTARNSQRQKYVMCFKMVCDKIFQGNSYLPKKIVD